MRRILFFAEAVTLAHLARPLVLASGLDPAGFEAIIACHPRCARFLTQQPWTVLPLQSISSTQFLQSLARGSPVFDAETLRRYVREDLELIRQVEPDLIVGDFRISLSVSARLAHIPYVTVTNAYWSPYCVQQDLPLPALPMTRVLPIPLARLIFRGVLPLAMAQHCRPLNLVRAENGLASLGPDLRRVYTDADYTLYADAAVLFPTRDLPSSHHFIGPILWSPPVGLPHWWHTLPDDRPVVYLTLGSSGDPKTTALVLRALGTLPVTVIASMAGSSVASALAPNIHAADYLPGTEAAARCSLVICNGGSPTSQQAVAAGVPVLCIAGNADQFLNAAALVAAGCARLLRADRLQVEAVRAAVSALLASPGALAAARALRRESERYAVQTDFNSFADEVCSRHGRGVETLPGPPGGACVGAPAAPHTSS